MRLTKPFSQDELAFALGVMGAVQFDEKGFQLKIHREHPEWNLEPSPYYVNLRLQENKGPLVEWQVKMLGQHMALHYHQEMLGCPGSFQIIGIPATGIPLAEGFCEAWPNPNQINLLKMSKEGEGKGQIASKIEGEVNESPILLLDDVITKGGSKFDTLKAMGLHRPLVKKILVLVDREQGGKEEMAQQGIKLHSAITFSRILEASRTSGMIDEEMYQHCVDYPAALDAAIKTKQGA